MDILGSYMNLWSVLESFLTPLTVLFGLFLFFNDPIRRWQFFGYRPSLVIILFDPKKRKVLLTRRFSWEFPQGSVYGSDVYSTLEQILKRELNIESNCYRLQHVHVLGTAELTHDRDRRRTLGIFSLFKRLKGKGYIACFTQADFTRIKKSLTKGIDVDEVQIVSYNAALQRMEVLYKQRGKHQKLALIKKVFKELERLS